jgi:hypothetical protein
MGGMPGETRDVEGWFCCLIELALFKDILRTIE